jgi:hypothetical protein
MTYQALFIAKKGNTQIKFTIDTATVASFKTKCKNEGVSMTSAVRDFMGYGKPPQAIKSKTATRPLRRKTALEIISLLKEIELMEEIYRDAIPEQFVQRYDNADMACEKLAEAILCLEEAYY